MPDPITIEEDVPNGLRVELRESDLPYARPREIVGLETGGPVEHEEIYLPGRELPIYQVQQARHRPLVLKGAFRDHLAIRDGLAGEGSSHARAQEAALERIRARANPLRIVWGDKAWSGLLTEARFGHEAPDQITYELTFKVARAELGAATEAPADDPRAVALSDITTQLRAQIAARQAELAAGRGVGVAREVTDRVRASLDLVDAALGALADAVASLQAAGPGGVAGAALRVLGLARVASTATAAAQLVVRIPSAAEAVPDGAPGALAAWWRSQFGTAAALDELADQLRTVATSARASTRQTVRLYEVRPGDTLESIARAVLGNAARAGDLGVRADQLEPGLVLRIPEAA